MSAKPTPGPYTIETHLPDRIRLIGGNSTCIAVFRELSYDGGRAEAEANARAFVDGIEAIAKLERIRKIVGAWLNGEHGELCMGDVAKVINEAKP